MTSARPRSGAGPDEESGLPAALRNDLGWALGVVFRAYVKSASATFADVPGGPRGYQVLAAANRCAPRSQQELAHHLAVDRTVMTYLLDDLERAGLIKRYPDPADRRARRIAPTEHGRDLLGDLDERLGAAELQVLGGLTAPDRERFRVLLGQAAAHASAEDPLTDPCALAGGLDNPKLDQAPR
jgi:DNA-binding MarR family transcriptional regulator